MKFFVVSENNLPTVTSNYLYSAWHTDTVFYMYKYKHVCFHVGLKVNSQIKTLLIVDL